MWLLAWVAHGAAAQGLTLDLRLDGTPAPPPAHGTPVASPSGGAEAGQGDSYRIDTGDRVSIRVYDEPDLAVEGARVRADGRITMPLLGDLEVRGLTSSELGELVTRRLADGYLKKPVVSVSIDAYRLFYIKGEVARPGGYSYRDGLTVEKAIALAGGFTPRAAENDITLVRESDPDRPLEDVAPSTRVRPGDVITIGESFF